MRRYSNRTDSEGKPLNPLTGPEWNGWEVITDPKCGLAEGAYAEAYWNEYVVTAYTYSGTAVLERKELRRFINRFPNPEQARQAAVCLVAAKKGLAVGILPVEEPKPTGYQFKYPVGARIRLPSTLVFGDTLRPSYCYGVVYGHITDNPEYPIYDVLVNEGRNRPTYYSYYASELE